MPITTLYQSKHCQWIDFEAPTKEDFAYLVEKFNINQLLLDDTLESNHLPKYE